MGSITPVTIDDATTETDEPEGSFVTNSIHESVWYQWTAPSDGLATFSTAGSLATDDNGDAHGGLDTTVTAWTGDPTDFGTLVEAGSNDDDPILGSGHYTSRLHFRVESGTVYYIQVGTYDTPYTGELHMDYGFEPITFVGPDNNSCDNAYELVDCGGTIEATNEGWAGTWPTGADPLFIANGVGGGAPLWFKWTNTRTRPMLFSLTISEPDTNAVNYNIGIGISADCAGVVFDEDKAELYGQMAKEFGNTGEIAVDFNFGPSFPSLFDIVVDPGHTVWIELDSYSGDASEPPDASANLGNFFFEWAALEYTSFDTTQGADQALVSDVTTLFDDIISGADSFISPLETIIVNGHLYLLWTADSTGLDIYVGDCELDGSSFTAQKVFDDVVDNGALNGIPRLMTDGTDVFVGWAWGDSIGIANPDYTDSCAAHSGEVESGYCFECIEGAIQNRFSIFKFDGGGSWSQLYSYGEAGSDSFIPTIIDIFTDAGDSEFSALACASDAQPGKIWIHAVYRVNKIDQTLHFNEYPLGNSPPGSLWCTNDNIYVVEYVDTFEFDVATATSTLINRDENILGNLQTWDHDDPTIDPLFGDWQFYDDGDLITDSTTPRDSILYGGWDIKNDDGFPIIAYCAALTVTPDGWVTTFDNNIIFKRLDTATTLGTWAYDDFSLGFDSSSTQYCLGINLTDKFVDPDDSVTKRGIATGWVGPTYWTDKIISDGTTAPEYIVPGNSDSSRIYLATLIPDTLVEEGRQWWGIKASNPTTFEQFEYCDPPDWRVTWDGFHGPDDLGVPVEVSPKSAYDPVDEYWYFITNNQLRRAKVLRNYWICQPGEPCISGCPPSILWFYRDGQWRQQNVDTEHALWVYRNGEWVQDCTELYGHLAGTWQN